MTVVGFDGVLVHVVTDPLLVLDHVGNVIDGNDEKLFFLAIN